MLSKARPGWQRLFLGLCMLSGIRSGRSAFVEFSDCLEKGNLHFVPIHVDAKFDTRNDSHALNVTVYGNVTGGVIQPSYGPYDADNHNLITTLISKFNVLQYVPFERAEPFCDTLINGKCPLGTSSQSSPSSLTNLSAFSKAHNLDSSYAFTTISSNFLVKGDRGKPIACVTAYITPDFGSKIASLLTYIPLVILILAGAATIFAGIFSPWGTSDIFRWTSNYGRDQDLLRLVTPGFGDCLQYIQFIVLTGSLSLNYPGFYQPAVSQASWSILMFNKSFASHGNGLQSIHDGVYTVNATRGLDRMRQYVGLEHVEDLWVGSIIWLLVILGAVLFLTQVGFLIRWIYRKITAIPEEDLRAKNLPFSVGNFIRIVFNYFLLPIVTFSMFQFVEAPYSPAYVTALAAVVFVFLIGFSVWVLNVIARTRPRSHLFDDLPTVLLYGPLYNTYSDDSAAFALIPVFLTFVRGIAIGAVQPSGVAQVVLLAICEVVFILTLVTFKPFQSPTSMNVYHTFFSIIRLIATLLSIVFVPSLKISESSKGWVGYVILLMHAIALVFGFFLNTIQTFVEVGVRMAGAGGEGMNTTRGGLVKVFGKRQLSRRIPQRHSGRQSALSGNMTLHSDQGRKSSQLNGRTRSFSGSSAKLLGRGASDGRASVGLDNMSAGGGHQRQGSGHSPFTPSTPGGGSTFSQFNGNQQQGGILGIKTAEATASPYYRPPRGRRQNEKYSPAVKTRGSWASGDWLSGNPPASRRDSGLLGPVDAGEGPSASGRATPVPPFGSSQQYPSDPNLNEPNRRDYAFREVDLIYHQVRGPALNTAQTRRLGTGPADPTGPVASAAGWLKGLFGGKTKDKGKGFEVVRSSRMPPSMMAPKVSEENSTVNADTGPSQSRELNLDIPAAGPPVLDDGEISPVSDDDNNLAGAPNAGDVSDDEEPNISIGRSLDGPPSLPNIDAGDGIELPLRKPSKPNTKYAPKSELRPSLIPEVPRKSSKRGSSHSPAGSATGRLSARSSSPPRTPPTSNSEKPLSTPTPRKHRLHPSFSSTATHIPFGSETSSVRPSARAAGSLDSSGLERGFNPGLAEELIAPQFIKENDEAELRPTSVGYVQQHRASDNIHRMNSAEKSKVSKESIAAEVVNEPPIGQ